MTTTQVNNFVGDSVVKLRGVNSENRFCKNLPVNDNEDNFNEKLNDNYYKIIVKKLHDAGCKVVISLLMLICLIMDVVCLGIHISMLNN